MNITRKIPAILITFACLFFLLINAAAENCLWRVKSDQSTLYLQGSVHLLKAEHYPLPPALQTAYSNSAVVVLEMDLNEMLKPEIQQRMMAKAMLKGTNTLDTLLSANTRKQLHAALNKAGLPAAGFQSFEPWFTVTTLTLMHMQALGFQPQHGLDHHFTARAMADKKPLKGLESAEFQIDLFASLAQENPNEVVLRALKELELLEQDLEKLITHWQKGEIEEVGKLINQSFEEYPRLHQTFITERNRRWMKALNAYLKKPKTHFVVVGAGHLPGAEGLLTLLKNEGYELEQL